MPSNNFQLVTPAEARALCQQSAIIQEQLKLLDAAIRKAAQEGGANVEVGVTPSSTIRDAIITLLRAVGYGVNYNPDKGLLNVGW